MKNSTKLYLFFIFSFLLSFVLFFFSFFFSSISLFFFFKRRNVKDYENNKRLSNLNSSSCSLKLRTFKSFFLSLSLSLVRLLFHSFFIFMSIEFRWNFNSRWYDFIEVCIKRYRIYKEFISKNVEYSAFRVISWKIKINIVSSLCIIFFLFLFEKYCWWGTFCKGE